MKRKTGFFIIMILISLVTGACGPVTSDVPDCKKESVFCIGLVTDLGKIDDNAINQSTWEGIKQAQKNLGTVGYYIETTDSKDYEKNIATFGEAAYDLIITAGYAQSTATLKAAAHYPKILFIGIDQVQEPTIKIPKNLVNLVFPEDKAGFLMGALAAQMSTSKKIGAVCSRDDIPFVWRYGEGFKAGATYIDPSVEVTVTYHNEVNFEKSLNDSEWGKATANTLIGQGVDLLFGVGGNTGYGAILAAADKSVYALGIDYDRYYSLPEAQKILLSSAVKLVTPIIFELIKAAKEDQFPGGKYYNGKVGYAPFHDLEKKVPVEIKAKMLKISIGLSNGTTKTNVEQVKPVPTSEPTPIVEPTPTP
ncbi:MAG: BMP family ABC transporter substrate-binding protein [Chloroflexota bacterium]